MGVMLIMIANVHSGAADVPVQWKPPASFDAQTPGLGLPPLEGAAHTLIYDPLPSKCNVDEGGDGRYESLRHGTYSHHQRILLVEDKFIVYWTQHSRDENGPGQRLLAKVGTFNADRTDIDWGGDETLFEIALAPVPVRRKRWEHDPDLIYETYAGGKLVAASPLYKRSEPVTQVEVATGRFKKVLPPIEPYASAVPIEQAPERMRGDVLNGVPQQFARIPKYAPGTWKLTKDGTSGLAHHTEFRRPDGSWVAIRDNLCKPGYYYAAEKARYADDYPLAKRTNLFGHAMPVAGELPDGRPWIICNNQSRFDMYLTLSEDGRTFDQTWLLLHKGRGPKYPGMHKGGGPQYFQAVTVGGNIWVVYSIAKEQVGVTRIPISALPAPKTWESAPTELRRETSGRPAHPTRAGRIPSIPRIHNCTTSTGAPSK